MTTDALDAARLAGTVAALSRALEAHRETLNRLNVFPVPDGDTGTNMALTAKAADDAVRALVGAGAQLEMRGVCDAIAHGSLMGARGNSGVILCQILRGLTASLADRDVVEAPLLVEALEQGAGDARAAVLRPQEGTILTVASEAAAGARAELERGGDLIAVVESARSGAIDALFETPKLLPVLAQAGVVDAGGAGLVLLFDALLTSLDGRALPEDLELPDEVAAGLVEHVIVVAPQPELSGEAPAISPRYEVMYLLDAPDATIPAFKEVWAGLGDSIVVVGGGGLWNCHVHTDDIGAAIEAALDVGRPREIRVSDLSEQVEEEQWVRSGAGASEPERDGAVDAERPRTAVVAVAIGEGVNRIFASLGVRAVVAGSQTMNPSTAEILQALDAVAGDEVVILPNNKNVFPVAAQAARLATKAVEVVETKGIQEGFAALLEYDPRASSADNAERMREAAGRVVAGEVTQAVRAATTKAGEVREGDWLGLSREGVEVVADRVDEAACALLDRLLEEHHELVTLIEGATCTPGDARRVSEWLRAHHPDLTIERHAGGQPLYPFLLAIE